MNFIQRENTLSILKKGVKPNVYQYLGLWKLCTIVVAARAHNRDNALCLKSKKTQSNWRDWVSNYYANARLLRNWPQYYFTIL